MKMICAISIAAISIACGASESHNSSESGLDQARGDRATRQSGRGVERVSAERGQT